MALILGVLNCGIYVYSAKTADAENADALFLHFRQQQQVIHSRAIVFCINFAVGKIPRLSTAFAAEKWVKGQGMKPPFSRSLRVKAGALFFHGFVWAAYRNRGATCPSSFQVCKDRHTGVCHSVDNVRYFSHIFLKWK